MRILMISLLVILHLSVAGSACGEASIPDWQNIPYDPYPLSPAGTAQPVLTAADVTDENALFVADPFMMHEADIWHMFFEVYTDGPYRGKIGHATSMNGLAWNYDQIVFETTAHLAFPFVFKHDDAYYMLLGLPYADSLNLLKAHDYPYDWRLEATILSGRPFVDPVVIRHNDLWWLFTGRNSTGHCDLFYSDSLASGWIEHPMSPIVNDVAKGRPAGRFFVFGNGRIVRLAQKNDQWYGQAVRAFEVDLLTTTSYLEHEIPESPILRDSGSGWNSDGMHTCDAWWNGDHWLAVVDGIEEWWSIGIYRTDTVTGTEEPVAGERPTRISLGPNKPNPFNRSTRILYHVLTDPGPVAVRLRVYDVEGCLVRELMSAPSRVGQHTVPWDGTDARGRPIPDGIYYYRLDQGNETVTKRMVRVR